MQTEAGPTQITWEHIYDPGWRIRMETRKQNIKSKKARPALPGAGSEPPGPLGVSAFSPIPPSLPPSAPSSAPPLPPSQAWLLSH